MLNFYCRFVIKGYVDFNNEPYYNRGSGRTYVQVFQQVTEEKAKGRLNRASSELEGG